MSVILNEAENALCLILTYLPPIFLAMVPFKEKLRFSKPIVYTIIALLCVTELILAALSFYFPLKSTLWIAISLITCAVSAMISIKAHPGKIIFTLLILSNLTNCIMVLSKWLESIIFGKQTASETYNYTYAISILIISTLVMMPVYYYFKTVYRKGVQKNVKNTPWSYLWLIPATFYLTWLHHLSDNGLNVANIAFETEHAMFFLVLNAGAFFAYHTVILMIEMQNKNLELERRNHSLTLQTLQHDNLKERIAEARRAKHDLRHHIIFLDSCLQNGEYEKATEYLKGYKKSLPDDSIIVFCEHTVINALLLYFAQLSKNDGIDFDVVVMDVPQSTNLPDNIFSVILGNLLENALDACREQKEGDRIISIRSKANKDSFFLHIENTFDGKTIRDKNGDFISSKSGGSGLGLKSIQKVVERYNGVFEAKESNSRFAVSVFLNIPQ